MLLRGMAFFGMAFFMTLTTHPSQAQDAAAGKKAFVYCNSCHVADKDTNGSGPSLYGIIGRTAGTHPGYTFSKAMIAAGKSGVVWDEPTLATFLRRPSAMIEGNKMMFAGLMNADDITHVIAYLKQTSQ